MPDNFEPPENEKQLAPVEDLLAIATVNETDLAIAAQDWIDNLDEAEYKNLINAVIEDG